MRWYRSSRKLPLATMDSRSLLVAAMKRTSTGMGRPPPIRSKLRSCKTRKSFACSSGLSSAISSRKKGAARRELEASSPLRVRAGEGALLVTEELALEQVLGERGAVDRDEGPVGALAPAVDGVGRDLFPGPALAEQEHGRLRSGHLSERGHHLGHVRISVAQHRLVEVALAGLLDRAQRARRSRARSTKSTSSSGPPNGFSRKSNAPSFIARTAVSTEPCAVRTSTSRLGSASRARSSNVIPVHLRHLQIGDQEIEAGLRELAQGGLAVLAGDHVVPGSGERIHQELADAFFVVDDQNSGQNSRLLGDRDHEDGAAFGVIRGADLPTVKLHDALGDREPEADALGTGSVKRLEDALFLALRDTFTVVTHADLELVLLGEDANADRLAALGRLLRVVEQVREDLLHAHSIERPARGRLARVELDCGTDRLRGARHELDGVDALGVDRAGADELEQGARQPLDALGFLHHALGLAVLDGLGLELAEQELCVALERRGGFRTSCARTADISPSAVRRRSCSARASVRSRWRSSFHMSIASTTKAPATVMLRAKARLASARS